MQIHSVMMVMDLACCGLTILSTVSNLTLFSTEPGPSLECRATLLPSCQETNKTLAHIRKSCATTPLPPPLLPTFQVTFEMENRHGRAKGSGGVQLSQFVVSIFEALKPQKEQLLSDRQTPPLLCFPAGRRTKRRIKLHAVRAPPPPPFPLPHK